jgi:hypothetical protein
MTPVSIVIESFDVVQGAHVDSTNDPCHPSVLPGTASMNCESYLSMLATLPVGELQYGDARAHAANCRDCDRVTRVVTERERNMVLAYNEVYEPIAAAPMAERVLVLSRRRRVALYYRVGLAVAGAATIFFMIVSRRVTPAPVTGVRETFRLQCLSPAQALEILRPIRSPAASISAHESSPLGLIIVAAPPAEMERLRAVLERYDSPAQSQCGVQLTVRRATHSAEGR